jgi:hypothetical protein
METRRAEQMNYKTIQTTSQKYNVIETTTNQIVKVFTLQKEAKEFMRHLNLGGGFDGWTPSFLLKNVGLQSKSSEY